MANHSVSGPHPCAGFDRATLFCRNAVRRGAGGTHLLWFAGPGGGRVPVVLYSPQVKNGFEDPTPYTHYSLLKTISEAWGLPYLGHAADESNALIVAPWK